MKQTGKIKLMSKNLTSKECSALASYYREEAGKRWRSERDNEVLSLGVGGRVVYSANTNRFDVTGKSGTIKSIKKRRGTDEYVVSVEFDSPVWFKMRRDATKEFYDWWKEKSAIPEEKERILQKTNSIRRSNTWSKLRVVYENETGKSAYITYKVEGSILINISPRNLRPATESNIEAAKMTREYMPVMKALNKTFADALNRK